MILDTYYIDVKYRIDDSELKRQTAQLQRASRNIHQTVGAGGGANPAAGGGGTTVIPLGMKYLPAVGGAALALKLVKDTVKAAADLQQAMIGVQKTTGLSNEAINTMRKNLLWASSTEVAINPEKLAAYAEAVGTIGFEREEDILSAAVAMGKLEKASDLQGAGAARSLGKILNLTKSSKSEFEELGTLLVRLGGKLNGTESEIAHVANFMGGVASQFKLSKEELLAMAGAFQDVSVSAESATTTTQSVFTQLQRMILAGGKEMEHLVDVMQMSEADIQNLWKTDKVELFARFTQSISEYATRTKQTNAGVLKDMNLGGVTLQSTIGKIGGSYDRVAYSVKLVKDEVTKYGTKQSAVNKENDNANQSLNSQLELMANGIRGLGDAAANSGLLGFLTDVVKWINTGIESFGILHQAAQDKKAFVSSNRYVKEEKKYIASLTAQQKAIRNMKNAGARDKDFSKWVKEKARKRSLKHHGKVDPKSTAGLLTPIGSVTTTTTNKATIVQNFRGPVKPKDVTKATTEGVTKALSTKGGKA